MRLGLRLPQRLATDDELQATGATRADRGRFLNETLDVFDAAWGPDPVTFKGPRVTIDHASVLPKPVSKIPVLLGGGGSNLGRATSSKALQRIAKRADGWMPVLATPDWSALRSCAQGGIGSGRWPRSTAGRRAEWRWWWSAM